MAIDEVTLIKQTHTSLLCSIMHDYLSVKFKALSLLANFYLFCRSNNLFDRTFFSVLFLLCPISLCYRYQQLPGSATATTNHK